MSIVFTNSSNSASQSTSALSCVMTCGNVVDNISTVMWRKELCGNTIRKAVFSNCFGLRGPHNLPRLHGLNIHSGNGSPQEAFCYDCVNGILMTNTVSARAPQ